MLNFSREELQQGIGWDGEISAFDTYQVSHLQPTGLGEGFHSTQLVEERRWGLLQKIRKKIFTKCKKSFLKIPYRYQEIVKSRKYFTHV